MPRGSNLARVRGSKEQLAARFGVEPLKPGEAGRMVWVRASAEVLERFERLNPAERGRVVEMGLRVLEGEDATPDQ